MIVVLADFATLAAVETGTSLRIKRGVRKMPRTLPMTALKSAVATLPPAEPVSTIHMFTVVGRQKVHIRPSITAEGKV